MVRLTFVSILFRIKLLKHNFRIKNRIKSSFVASKVRDEREREKKNFLSLNREIFVRASTKAKLIDDEEKILRFLRISSEDFAAITKQYPNPIQLGKVSP